MEAKETDKLFRDKLKNAPSVPKAESWQKLEGMLDEKKKTPAFVVWRVAAAILVLLTSSLLTIFWNNEGPTENHVVMIDSSSESIPDNNQIVPEIKVDTKKEEVDEVRLEPEVIKLKTNTKASSSEEIKTPVKVKKAKETEPVKLDDEPVLTETQLAEVDNTMPVVEDLPKKKKIKSIKITYKRGSIPSKKQEDMLAKQEVDSTGGNKIKELWEQTREIKPGDLWADIREAKDNLFQRNSKKNNVKNLNK